jgi:hypothetical protein
MGMDECGEQESAQMMAVMRLRPCPCYFMPLVNRPARRGAAGRRNPEWSTACPGRCNLSPKSASTAHAVADGALPRILMRMDGRVFAFKEDSMRRCALTPMWPTCVRLWICLLWHSTVICTGGRHAETPSAWFPPE